MKTLFVTATAQTEANYYLIWHLFKANESDVNQIVIISTDFTRKQGYVDNLIKLLTFKELAFDASIQVDVLHLADGIEESSVDAIKEVLLDWLSEHKPTQVIFNITGGTKLISIAQDQIAQLHSHHQCVYQSRNNNQLVWYNNPPNQQRFDLILPENIIARLKGRGFELRNPATSFLNLPARQFVYATELSRYMRADFKKARRLVLLLNALSAKPLNDKAATYPYTITMEQSSLLNDLESWLKLLAQIEDPYFAYDSQAGTLTWHSKEDAAFVSGRWFEVFVSFLLFSHFAEQKRQVELLIGLEFKRSSDGNEIDVAYLDQGHLNLFECKTVNWERQSNPTNKVNTDLHKLVSVGQVGGLNSHNYFVSLFDISEQSLAVAKDSGVTVVMGRQILDIANYLQSS